MIELILSTWALVVIITLACLLKQTSARAFFWAGAALVSSSVLTVVGLISAINAPLTATQEVATQLVLITGAAVGANFIAHAFTSRSKA